ncbi:hypothetical protein HYV49_02060 [Candidatus Pacearchaeota archaeon]|nr:hypothetical protein [Candidatus Pacearchaeota archaeon]
MFRPATLQERKEFYEKEFDIKKVESWLNQLPFKPCFFAIDCGTDSGIIKDKSKKGKLIYFKPNLSLKELRKKLIFYLPEDVYYDRDIYKDANLCIKNFDFKKAHLSTNYLGQELVFDIDPENIKCKECAKKSAHDFCEACSKIAIQNTYNFYLELKKQFSDVKVVFSGRGAHVHVLDKNAYYLTLKQRNSLNKKYKKFAIDPWVSHGRIHLIRLPYTLNSLSSRIVTPLDLKDISKFSPDNLTFIPGYISSPEDIIASPDSVSSFFS